MRGLLPVVLALAAACGTSSKEWRADLLVYLQQAAAWAPVEAETARTLERILATQFVDEPEVLHQIADSRPRILAHLEQLHAHPPTNPRLRKIHDSYVSAWEGLLAGYGAIEEGFSSGDYTKLARGREAMAAWRDGIVEVARELRDAASEAGIQPEAPTPS